MNIVHTIHIGPADMADAFARADNDGQAVFFHNMAKYIDEAMPGARWPVQCRAITDSEFWDEEVRALFINQLEALIDHLKNPATKE